MLTHLAASAGWRLTSPFRRPGCLVLTYHRIEAQSDVFPHVPLADFRRQLEWLTTHCRVIQPSELRAAVRAPGRRPAVLLTFDDGYRNYHDVVCPLLRRFGLKAAAFPLTGYLDDPNRLTPWDRVCLAVRHARVNPVVLPWKPGATVAFDRRRPFPFIYACRDYLNSVPDDRRAELVAALEAALDPAPAPVERQLMTWDELRSTLDVTTIGAHSHTHPVLSLAGADRIAEEIVTCRDRLRAQTGTTVTWFAYPHGDVAPGARALLPSLGFDTAFSTRAGINDESTDWLAVKRLGAGRVMPTRWMVAQAWRAAPAAAD